MMKVCPKCGVEKKLTEENWYKHPTTKSGFDTSRCKTCRREYQQTDARREYQREYRKTDAYREYMREYRKTDAYREYMREYMREYHQTDARREYMQRYSKEPHRKRNQKYRNSLSDSYVRDLLSQYGFSREDITPSLIELKRQQLIMKRLLKNLKKWRKENESDSSDV